jgi:hypothetical protein
MKANQSGQFAEDMLAATLRSIGITFERQCVLGETIYGTNLRVDFVLRNIVAFPRGIAVESKWQDVGGSIDEKFPFLVENIYRQYPLPAMVVVHGGGCRPGALAWLRMHCDGQQLVGVYTLEEFISWALRVDKLAIVTTPS